MIAAFPGGSAHGDEPYTVAPTAILFGMDPNQTKIIELLREVHLIAFKEIERLNLRIAELEIQGRQPIEKPVITPPIIKPPAVNPAAVNQPSAPEQSIMAGAVCFFFARA